MNGINPISTPILTNGDRAAAEEVAKELEASFLAEMFKYTGVGNARESMGGGHGEEAFTGMLSTEYARSIVDQGGIGLAEQIVKSMLKGTADE